MQAQIRSYTPTDAHQVRELFMTVNRMVAPKHMRDAFKDYIQRSLAEEIDRIPDYYQARDGGFWVADAQSQVVGMFGLEATSPTAMELRRMYVAPEARRQGLARRMLEYAERECRRRGKTHLVLSTSEVQGEALALYRSAGFTLVREEIAQAASNKTIGGGLRRYHFAKHV